MNDFKEEKIRDYGRHELLKSNGQPFYRAAYVSKEKDYYRLFSYNIEIASIHRKTKKKEILGKHTAKVTQLQIEEFFKQYENREEKNSCKKQQLLT